MLGRASGWALAGIIQFWNCSSIVVIIFHAVQLSRLLAVPQEVAPVAPLEPDVPDTRQRGHSCYQTVVQIPETTEFRFSPCLPCVDDTSPHTKKNNLIGVIGSTDGIRKYLLVLF